MSPSPLPSDVDHTPMFIRPHARTDHLKTTRASVTSHVIAADEDALRPSIPLFVVHEGHLP